MTATDPTKALAREIADLRRRLASVERSSQGVFRSFEVDGESVTLPQVARTGTVAQAAAGAAKIDAEAARLAAVEATTAAQGAATMADDAQAAALEAAGIAADAGKIVYTTSEPAGDASTLWIPPPDNAPRRWDGSKWVVISDASIKAAADRAAAAEKAAADAASAAQQAQNTASAASGKADTALTTALGKNTVTYSTAAPSNATNPGIRAGDLWYQIVTATGVVIGTWRWSGLVWSSAVFGDAVLSSLTVGKLVTGQIAAGQKIIAGPASGTHAEMASDGFRVFANDPSDGIPNEVIRLGTSDDDYFAIVGGNNVLNASIDSTGRGNFSGISTGDWPEISAADHTGRGGDLLEILDRRPRGLTAWGSDLGAYDSNTTAGRGIFDITARLFFNRMYVIKVRCRINGTVANDALAEVQVRYTQSQVGGPGSTPAPPAAPNINSPLAGRIQASTARPEAQGVYLEKPFALGSGLPGNYLDMRFLLCLARPVGGTTLTMWGPQPDGIEMWIEDVGPFLQATATRNDGGGTVQVPGPPPAPQVQRFTRSWTCNWHQNWRGNNSFVDLAGAYQGLDPSGNNGNMKSYLGFSGVDREGGGQTLSQALSGSVVESVGVYLYSAHWYYNAGGEPIIGMHGYVNPAPSWGGGNEWMVGGAHLSKPGGAWINLDAAGGGNWANGTWKGILLGSGLSAANNLDHYGRFDAEGSAVLSITYRK